MIKSDAHAIDIKNEEHIEQTSEKGNNIQTKSVQESYCPNGTVCNTAISNGSDIQASTTRNADVNGEKRSVTVEINPLKRRGRPRKSVPSEFESSESKSSLDNNSKPSVPTERKRGRTKKVSNAILSDSESGDNLHCSKNESNCKNDAQNATNSTAKRRGRPRKKVKYISSDSDLDDTLTEEVESNGSTFGDSHNILNNNAHCLKNSPSGEGHNNGVETAQKSKDVTSAGYTAFAVNHMLQALQRKDVVDASKDLQVSTVKKKGRLKVNNKVILDEDGETVCMVCNQTVVNKNWLKHKRKAHYNLTWRKGEIPIDVSDIQVMQKILIQLRKEQGHLKCNNCESHFGNVKQFIEHLEICNGIVSPTGLITCAVCKAQMLNSNWQNHKYKEHNNLAWREKEPPLNLEDQDLVTRILTQLYKSKKPLHCELCKQQKKSVLGYLSHKSVCQLNGTNTESVKVTCELCGRKMLPVSLSSHMRNHANHSSAFEKEEKSGYFNVEEVSNKKRKAATSARLHIQSLKGESINSSQYYVSQCDFEENFVINKLKKLAGLSADLSCIFNDCEFKSNSVSIMGDHLNSCARKPEQYFVCKICLFWTEEETSVQTHVQEIHKRTVDTKDGDFGGRSEASGSEADEFMDEIDAQKRKLSRKAKTFFSQGTNTKVKPIFLMHPIKENRQELVYPQAYYWMLSFCGKYYSNSSLFDCFRNSESRHLLDCDILIKYLPKYHESCDITVKTLTASQNIDITEDEAFTKIELFQYRNFYEGEATLFCGGPVGNLAWLPTPYNEPNHSQILAVSVLNNADIEYDVEQIYNEPHIIQFWKFDDLKDRNISPIFLLGLAVNAGPIWHIEWCPSGCLDVNGAKSNSRLGLLAVATSDSYVYIYSVDDVENESDRGLIYQQKPVVKLQLEVEKVPNGRSYYATKTSWTKANGHRYIAVGYSTGLIAIYDLVSTSSLLRRRDQTCITTILPCQMFQGHVSCIAGLTLSHYSGGNRYLFSTSLDKFCIHWDLYNNTKVSSYRKFGISDGMWLTQWPTSLVAEDETTFNETNLAQTLVKSVREIMSGEYWCRFTFSQSGIKSISFSDWLNLILHGGNAGEVMGQFAHRMFCNIDKKQFKNSYIKCIFSTSKLVKKAQSSTVTPDVVTYDQASSHYGLAFLDYNSDKLFEIPNSKTSDVKRVQGEKYNIHDYPLQAINKVSLNPNRQSISIYATGHQAGFVRIRRMALLKNHCASGSFAEFNLAESL